MSSAHRSVTPLTAQSLGRYQRQMILPEVGLDGQQQLMNSRVLIVGAGALGSAAALYLAAAGVGTLGLIDGDLVDLSNLHRQILHDDQQIGHLKVESAQKRLIALNPSISVQLHHQYLTAENALDIVSSYDLIINGSDNFPARYLVNDAAVLTGKPLVDAAILRFEGHLMVFSPGQGCYRCLFPNPPAPGTVPDCAQAGIFGAVAGVMGSLQAVEALKLLLGINQEPANTLVLYDALTLTFDRFPFPRNHDCPVCGDHPTVTHLIDYEAFCGVAPTDVHALAEPSSEFAVDPSHALVWVQDPDLRIVDVREGEEFSQGHIPGAERWAFEDLDALPETGRILVVCAAGVRSAYATQYLRLTQRKAWSMAGGMAAWQASGYPCVSS